MRREYPSRREMHLTDMTSQKRKKLIDIGFIAAFAAILAFLLWKCRYGFGSSDEAFYLAVPFRLTQGDGLFSDEWHLSQMSSFLIYPFMKIYMLIKGDTEGIILAFRYIYTLLQATAAAFLYIRLKRISGPGAAVASLCFFIYAPFGIMAMSYNSLGIITLALSLTMLVTAREHIRLWQALSGFFFASAVLCCPYLIILWILYLPASLIIGAVRKKRYALSGWIFFSIGAACLALIFGIFVLSRMNIADIPSLIEGIMSDPEHQPRSAYDLIKGYFAGIFNANRFSKYIYILQIGLFAAAIIDKKRRSHRKFYFIFSIALCMLLLISSMGETRYINYVMLPVNAAVPQMVLLFEKKEIKDMFFGAWICALCYTFCIHMSSNQAYYVISSASAVAAVFAIMMIFCAAEVMVCGYREMPAEDIGVSDGARRALYIIPAITAVFMCLQLACEIGMRYISVFDYVSVPKESMSNCTYEMPCGPEKGILAGEYNYNDYMSFTENAALISSEYPNAKSILIRSHKTYGYMIFEDLTCSAYSAWLSADYEDGTDIDRLMLYYDIHPAAVPDLIYIEAEGVKDAEKFDQIGKYTQEELSGGAVLLVREE